MSTHKNKLVFRTDIQKDAFSTIEKRLESFNIFNNQKEYCKTNFEWILRRIQRAYTTEEKRRMLCSPPLIANQLNEKLTAKLVLYQLNNLAEFDFNYTPINGDELIMSIEYNYIQFEDNLRPQLPNDMRFYYENKVWYFGYFAALTYKSKIIQRGKFNF